MTSASSFGRLYTDTELTYDRRTDDIVRAKVESSNVLVTPHVQEIKRLRKAANRKKPQPTTPGSPAPQAPAPQQHTVDTPKVVA